MPQDSTDREIWVEVQPLPAGSATPEALRRLSPGASPVSGLPDRVNSVVQAAASELQTCIRKVADTVSAAVEQGGPESWTVEFSVAFKGTTAVPVIASGEASANMKVTLSWKRS